MSQRALFVLPILEGGGAERVAVDLSASLPDWDVEFALFERRVGYGAKAPVHVLGGNFIDPGPVAPRALRAGANIARLSWLRRSLRPSASVGFTLFANLVNVMALGPGRRVVSAHSHESAIRGTRLDSLLRPLVRKHYARADAIVAVSRSVAEDLNDYFGIRHERITVIYNGVDLEAARRASEAPVENDSLFACPTVVATGRLATVKGLWQLIGAWPEVRRSIPDARLVVLGDGPLREPLVREARALGLPTWAAWEATPFQPDVAVAFLGFQRNPFAYMARGQVFALPSILEGFGNVVVEAMALGLPVISSAFAGGPAEILGATGVPRGPVDRAPHGILVSGARDARVASDPVARARCERAWAEAVTSVLTSTSLRGALRDASLARAPFFSLERSAASWGRVMEHPSERA